MSTPPLRWYFDFISPFAFLQWPKVRALMETDPVVPVPIVFGAVLEAVGQKGPAEIPGKRAFTYRHALWRARQRGIELRFPPAHPFNPLAALRLCIAAGGAPAAIDAIFDWIWVRGEAGDSAAALAPVAAQLGVPATAIADDAVKAALRENTATAVAAGVFGVPTLAIGDALFWGDDAHDFALAVLRDPALLEDAGMHRVATLPEGVRRR
jgi:2-hydroxychromene-2-carboxylate isomerase